MSGSIWMFSDQIDDEDMDFMRHEVRDLQHGKRLLWAGTETCHPDGT